MGCDAFLRTAKNTHPGVDLLAWIKARNTAPAANYVNWIGRTVQQVGEEEALRQALEKFLQDNAGLIQYDAATTSP